MAMHFLVIGAEEMGYGQVHIFVEYEWIYLGNSRLLLHLSHNVDGVFIPGNGSLLLQSV